MIPGIKRPGMDYHQPAWKYKSSSGRRGKNRVVIRKERILKLLRRSIRGIIVEAIYPLFCLIVSILKFGNIIIHWIWIITK